MEDKTKLNLIKITHTLIWLFFNFVVFYMFYAAVVNKLDVWLWLGYGIIFTEGIVLLIFNSFCPVTVLARKFSNSTEDNFDIYLPNWLAKNNKLIYTLILVVVIFITVYQLLK